MFKARASETTFQHFLRLSAHATAVVCLAVTLLFLFGTDFQFQSLSVREWIGLGFFPVGVVIGLVLAWREELLGGVIILASIAGFYLVYGWLLSSDLRQGWVLLPFLVPAILFLIHGSLQPHGREAAAS
ncbi:MAG TPA: hypothetical protein VFZ23_18100 [Pyrinomonadaceae bacterium]